MVVPYRLPRPLRLGLYALAALILFVLCVLPTEELPETGTGDRIEHTIAWFVLTATGYLLAPKRRLAIPAFALLYGVMVEVVQALAPTGRHGDARDVLADALGVAIAVAGYLLVRRFARR